MQLAGRFDRFFGIVGPARLLEGRLERFARNVRESRPIPLRVRLWDGRSFELGHAPRATLIVRTPAALRRLVAPDLMSLGEAYVRGEIDFEGQVADVFAIAHEVVEAAGGASRSAVPGWRPGHSRARDRRAIQYHYDVSNDFYRLFLDRNLVYSCGYFRRDTDTLDAAQEQKLDHILTKLRLAPGERLLDIGCGWGALVFRAVERYGARAVGITLSRNQYDYVRERIREKGIGDRCEVRLQDYRDVPERGGFDKIASVGMFEHVGLANLPVYFRALHALLRDGGAVLNHGITLSDHEGRPVGSRGGDFIGKYVFPDGELPHVSLVLREMSAAGFEPTDVESLRRHYARTTALWAGRLEQNRSHAEAIAGEERYRIWIIYLAGCSYGFAQNWINLYQVLACKTGGPGMNTLPLTRDWMYAA